MRAAGQADTYTVKDHHVAVLDVRQRLAVGPRQVRGKHRKRHLRQPLEKHRLAEIELVVAGHEDVGLERIDQCDDVRALVDPRHQRRRQRVAAMREHHVSALRAFGLDHGGEAGEPAAAFPVRHRRLAHLVDVIGKDKGDLAAVRQGGALRKGQRGGEAKRDGTAANVDHPAVALARIGDSPLCCDDAI
jgi:hypothetical protein